MAARAPSLQSAWDDACAEFQKATGIDLKTTPESKTISGRDIYSQFDSQKARDAAKKHKWESAKTAISNTVVAVERVGQIAAQGASMVFGSPASIAMSGISFFIDAGLEVGKIGENINDLFGRIAAIMERFQIYRDHEGVMEPEMIDMANRLLIAIVSICGKCIKKLNENKAKSFFRMALFSDDGGIKKQLDYLASLEAQELQTKGALTLVASETNKRNIVKMGDSVEDIKTTGVQTLESVSQLSARSADQRILSEIMKKLGIEDFDTDKEYRMNRDNLKPQSCSWLKGDPLYQTWSNATDNQEPLLVLKGDEGFGKSYTLTAIIRDLLMRYPQGHNDVSRISVAYYYLNRVGKKDAPSSRGGPSIGDALRAWAWQIVNNDLFYRKDIYAVLREDPDMGDISELWQKLFLDRSDKKATFFVLLDGIHEMEDKERSELLSLVKAFTSAHAFETGGLKLLITSRADFVEELNSQIPIRFPIIYLKDTTYTDMKKYIVDQAGSLEIFKSKSSKIQELKSQVCSGLLEAAKGNFLLVDVNLREIGSKNDTSEVLAVLEAAKEGGNLSHAIADAIQDCNQTLNTREIQDLNTILLWVMYAEWPLRLYYLESILYMQRESLQPLSREIRAKFSALIQINEEEGDIAVVSLRYDSIADYFKNLSVNRELTDKMPSEALSKAEIRMIQHFIQKLVDQDMYDKIGFGQFFDQKLSRSDASVTVDCDNAHATIALECLRALTGEFSEEEKAKYTIVYGRYNLSRHLKKIDLDTVDPRLKAEIGPRLVKALTDPISIERTNKHVDYLWTFEDDSVEQVLRMLRSSAVVRKVAGPVGKGQDWVKTIVDHPTPAIALLEEGAKYKATLWLTSEDAETVCEHFQWLYGYCNKVQNAENPKVARITQAPDEQDIGAEEIGDVLSLVKSLQGSSILGPIALRNVGVTYRECGHISEAIDCLNQALTKDPSCLLAHESLSQTYGKETKDGPKPDFEKAIFHLDLPIEQVQKGKRIFSDVEPAEQLKSLLQDKALWKAKLGRYEESRKLYDNLLRDYPQDENLRVGLIFLLYEVQHFDEVVEMFEKLEKEFDETKRNRLSRLFHANVMQDEYHRAIFQAFKQTGKLFKIKDHYRQAIDAASKTKTKQDYNLQTYMLLTLHFATLLYEHESFPEERDEAIQLLERNIALGSRDPNVVGPLMLSARRLARMYIERAIAAGHPSTVADEMLEKVQNFARGLREESIESSWERENMVFGITREEIRSLLGHYYNKVKDTEKAREQLRPDVEAGVKLLSDEDPENDWLGYQRLGDALMTSGDSVNALAAFCMIQPTGPLPALEDLQLASKSESDPEGLRQDGSNGDATNEHSPSPQPALGRTNTLKGTRKLIGPTWFECSGDCGRIWTYYDDFHMCYTCLNSVFEDKCFAKLQRGELGHDVCNPNHEFFYIPPWDLASWERLQNGKVLVGSEVLAIDKWLEGIKRDWDLLET
ncbi:hypothetical protein EV356DRAFT_564727 [Viridothelium virens]|uniref:Fungal STAND N-terminal Goodbye domain-containing protein n=1 Tax=Viridothelium virens TaxID=1048519 RepID=A0A6A6HGX7_VIRVR|nr:hypothetical protein EV356DRAFT_564727 [Viridothelium virens]